MLSAIKLLHTTLPMMHASLLLHIVVKGEEIYNSSKNYQ